jgi:hypothetical protein
VKSAPKLYIGDGVYAEIDGYGNLVLTTENGFETTNTIVIEDAVLSSLLVYLKSVGVEVGA